MAIGSVGAVGGNYYFATSSNSGSKVSGSSIYSSNNSKDTAIISNTAKELAAQKAGNTFREEASESVSEKLAEQASGGN